MTTVTLPAALRNVRSTNAISVNSERFVAHDNSAAETPFPALILEHVTVLGNPGNGSYEGPGIKHSVTEAREFGAHILTTGWASAGADTSAYWKVAHLRPTPINGRYYRTLPTVTSNSALVQYWDDDHVSARFNSAEPWNILYGIDAPWPAGEDSYSSMGELAYAEVELSDDSSFHGKGAVAATDLAQSIEAADELVLVPGPEGALGLVKHNEDGTLPEQNEAVEYCDLVVAWIRGSRSVGTTAYLSMNVDSNAVRSFASVSKNADGTYLLSRPPSGTLWREDMVWMRAVMPEVSLPERIADSTVVTNLQTRLRAAESSFSQFNADLNSLAKDKEWCSEYEDSIQPYGMSARDDDEPQSVEYTVDVDAEIQVETDDTSSNLDGEIGGELGFSVSSATITATGTLSVQVTVSTTNEDDVYDEVDTDMVRRAVESNLGHSNFTIDDYDCTDYNEV